MADHDHKTHALATPEVPFSNGTEAAAWESAWCAYCVHDHEMHDDGGTGPGCDLLAMAMLAGTDDWRWPEAWLPEPDDGNFALPSRMICAQFEPCHKGGCTGDPGAADRAERVTEVTAYWRQRQTDQEATTS